MFRRTWGTGTEGSALPRVPLVHYDHHRGWSLSHFSLIIKRNNKKKQRQAVNYLPLFSTLSTLPVNQYTHLDIPGVNQNECHNMQLCTAFFLRPRSLPRDTQATFPTRPFETICTYGKAKKLRLRLTGSKDLLTVHNFTTFIHLLTNRAKGLLLKRFPAAGAHRSWPWSLCLQYASALTNHKPLMSTSHMLPDWELACNTAPSAILPGINWCRKLI